MPVDAVDAVSALAVCLAVLAARVTPLEGPLAAAIVGGFALSVSIWRLRGGRPWEALGWLAWVGAATVVVAAPVDRPASIAAVVGFVVLGLGSLVAGRLAVLPSVSVADERLE